MPRIFCGLLAAREERGYLRPMGKPSHIRTSVAALALFASVAALGCGDDDYGPYTVVGEACRADIDCAPGADCLRGGDFPEGTCSLPCNTHFDCTPGTACIDTQGGVCLVACGNDSYCRPGYKCKSKHDRDGVGDSLVCIK